MRRLENLVITALDILEVENRPVEDIEPQQVQEQKIEPEQEEEKKRKKIVNDGRIDPPFKGYIASFGAAIVQSGLLPAVIFFENEDSRSEAERSLVPATILKILLAEDKEKNPAPKVDNPEQGDEVRAASSPKAERKKEQEPPKLLSKYISESKEDRSRLLRRISDAAVALKIAMRTYSFEPANNPEADA